MTTSERTESRNMPPEVSISVRKFEEIDELMRRNRAQCVLISDEKVERRLSPVELDNAKKYLAGRYVGLHGDPTGYSKPIQNVWFLLGRVQA